MNASSDVGYHAQRQARWHYGEVAFWLVVLACGFAFPTRYLIMTDILRLALFTMSLDLILGYAGIVSLGHAAFFGTGAYTTAILQVHYGVNAWLGFLAGIAAGAAAGGVIGGLGSLTGAALGGFALGVTLNVLQATLPLSINNHFQLFAFAAVIDSK